MELKFRTQIIKQREKNIQLSFWDIGKELLEIQETKQFTEENHISMQDYVETHFSFSYASAKRYMQLAREYKDRLTVSSLGLTKALLLIQAPNEYKEELIKRVEIKQIKSRNELEKALSPFKETVGTKPKYSNDPQEHIYKLIREFDEKILPLKEGIKVSIFRWLQEANKYDDLELDKRKKKAKEMI